MDAKEVLAINVKYLGEVIRTLEQGTADRDIEGATDLAKRFRRAAKALLDPVDGQEEAGPPDQEEILQREIMDAVRSMMERRERECVVGYKGEILHIQVVDALRPFLRVWRQ